MCQQIIQKKINKMNIYIAHNLVQSLSSLS